MTSFLDMLAGRCRAEAEDRRIEERRRTRTVTTDSGRVVAVRSAEAVDAARAAAVLDSIADAAEGRER